MHASKACVRESVPWVRIPPFPIFAPQKSEKRANSLACGGGIRVPARCFLLCKKPSGPPARQDESRKRFTARASHARLCARMQERVRERVKPFPFIICKREEATRLSPLHSTIRVPARCFLLCKKPRFLAELVTSNLHASQTIGLLLFFEKGRFEPPARQDEREAIHREGIPCAALRAHAGKSLRKGVSPVSMFEFVTSVSDFCSAKSGKASQQFGSRGGIRVPARCFLLCKKPRFLAELVTSNLHASQTIGLLLFFEKGRFEPPARQDESRKRFTARASHARLCARMQERV